MGVKIFLSCYIQKVWSLKKFVLGKNNFFVHTKLVKALTPFNIEVKKSKIKQWSVLLYIERWTSSNFFWVYMKQKGKNIWKKKANIQHYGKWDNRKQQQNLLYFLYMKGNTAFYLF